MTNKSVKFETLKPFVFFFTLPCERIVFKTEALKDVLWDRKIYCLQACPCIIQPGNFTGWGSEGVKNNNKNDQVFAVTRVDLIMCHVMLG